MKIEFEVKDFPPGNVAEPWLVPVSPYRYNIISIALWVLKKMGAKTGNITQLTSDDYPLPRDFGKIKIKSLD